MALFFTTDGRVQSFEAQVKSDGSVRPRNYGEFSAGELGDQTMRFPNRKTRNKNQQNNTPLCNEMDEASKEEFLAALTVHLEKLRISREAKKAIRHLFQSLRPVTEKHVRQANEKWRISEHADVVNAINDLNDILILYNTERIEEVKMISSESTKREP